MKVTKNAAFDHDLLTFLVQLVKIREICVSYVERASLIVPIILR